MHQTFAPTPALILAPYQRLSKCQAEQAEYCELTPLIPAGKVCISRKRRPSTRINTRLIAVRAEQLLKMIFLISALHVRENATSWELVHPNNDSIVLMLGLPRIQGELNL